MAIRSTEQIERDFEERSKRPSRVAAARDLAAGHWVAFREHDTPPGHVLRRFPDGHVELVAVPLASPALRAS